MSGTGIGTDFTIIPVGHKTKRGRDIAVCPKCGRNGERTAYGDGSENFAHRSKLIGGFEQVVEACVVIKKMTA